jgi:hypothetical protein
VSPVTQLDALQGRGVEISQVLYPPCLCGCAYSVHRCANGCDCQGYKPAVPVSDFGTKVYRPWTNMPRWRQYGCAWLWKFERSAHAWRDRLQKG